MGFRNIPKAKTKRIFFFVLGIIACSFLLFWCVDMYNTPASTFDSYTELAHAGFSGSAPADFAGVAPDPAAPGYYTVCVTYGSLHTQTYWERILEDDSQLRGIQYVPHSVSEVCHAMLRVKAWLQGEEYRQTYNCKTSAAMVFVEDLGYRVAVETAGPDAAVVKARLEKEFGPVLHPWNEDAGWQVLCFASNSGLAVQMTPEFEPYGPIVAKTGTYRENS